MSRRSYAHKPWSDELLVLFILSQLHQMHQRGEGPTTVHHISTLPGMPYQRDERVRRLVEMLESQGLVNKVGDHPYVHYNISEEGRRWWEEHRSVLWFFQGIR